MYPDPADSIDTVDTVVDDGNSLLTRSGSDERRRLRREEGREEGREEEGEEGGEWIAGEEGAGGGVFALR